MKDSKRTDEAGEQDLVSPQAAIGLLKSAITAQPLKILSCLYKTLSRWLLQSQ